MQSRRRRTAWPRSGSTFARNWGSSGWTRRAFVRPFRRVGESTGKTGPERLGADTTSTGVSSFTAKRLGQTSVKHPEQEGLGELSDRLTMLVAYPPHSPFRCDESVTISTQQVIARRTTIRSYCMILHAHHTYQTVTRPPPGSAAVKKRALRRRPS